MRPRHVQGCAQICAGDALRMPRRGSRFSSASRTAMVTLTLYQTLPSRLSAKDIFESLSPVPPSLATLSHVTPHFVQLPHAIFLNVAASESEPDAKHTLSVTTPMTGPNDLVKVARSNSSSDYQPLPSSLATYSRLKLSMFLSPPF